MTNLGYQVRKGLDRVGFEADKKMRATRVRSEVTRLKKKSESATQMLAEKVIELVQAGADLDPELKQSAEEILTLRAEMQLKESEIEAINAEEWIAPPPPPPVEADPQAPAPQASPAAKAATAATSAAQRLMSYIEEEEKQVNCPRCGAGVRAMAAFCAQCGLKLQA